MSDFDYLKNYNIQKKIDKFAKKYKNKKIVIYGAGKLSDYIFKNYDLSKLNIIAVADKKFSKKGDTFNNIQGIEPVGINDIDFDVIIVFTKIYYSTISLLFEYGLYKKSKQKVKTEWILSRDLSYEISEKIKSLFIKKDTKQKYVFTFWEPKDKIPAYVKLCMKTWQKHLPDYKIIVLDYENLNEWLGYGYFDEYLYNTFLLAQQADAIRVALLYKYGGIWLDADTIITSDKINNIINHKAGTTLIDYHVGFIAAKKGSIFLKKWLKEIKKRILLHKLYRCFSGILKYFYSDMLKGHMGAIMYFGNGIINSFVEDMKSKDFISLDRKKLYALPEKNFYTALETSRVEEYVDFYFNDDFSDFIFDNEQGIIMLHNSWTPCEYRKMSEEEILEKNCTLSKILKKYIEE